MAYPASPPEYRVTQMDRVSRRTIMCMILIVAVAMIF
jgi:hypothetical protein